jgi:hypothetical protein
MTSIGALPAIDPLLAMIAAGCIAALLLHAAAAKLGDRGTFTQHLGAYGVRERVAPVLATLMPTAEILLALGLMTPWRGAAAAGSAVLLLIYGGGMAWQRAHGRRIDCGCGGAPLLLSWWLVARNVLLAALAVAAGLAVLPRTVGAADAAVAGGAVVLGALLYAALHQVLRHRGHRLEGRPGAASSAGNAA